jgi:hypothetical protein
MNLIGGRQKARFIGKVKASLFNNEETIGIIGRQTRTFGEYHKF